MSEHDFSQPPKNGKSVELKSGNPSPTPYHVHIYIDGKLIRVLKFTSKNEAERRVKSESAC